LLLSVSDGAPEWFGLTETDTLKTGLSHQSLHLRTRKTLLKACAKAIE
jgi:hypothetical protein